MTDTPETELRAITEKLCWNQATSSDLARLDAILAEFPELWQTYQDAIHLHVCLRHRFGSLQPAEPIRSRIRWLVRATVAVAAVAACLLVTWFGVRPVPTQEPFAKLTALQGELADGDGSLADNRVKLVAGLAEVTFQSGTVVVLEGPAELTLTGPARGILVAGNLAARVPATAGGFSLDTPVARITEDASEFGVAVTSDGTTLLQVYDGTVWAGNQEIAAGGAIRFTEQGEMLLAFDPARFVREMPPFESRPGKGNDQKLPYNRSIYTGMRIPWAAVPPRIDGDLRDWDQSSSWSAKCDPPYADAYRAKGYAVYDDVALYLGAEVADPHPLRNRADIATGSEVWAGGSVIVRLSTDPALGFPVDVRKPDLNLKRPPTPRNTSDRLNHLILWYSRPDDRACLDVSFGMDEHGRRRNPEGFRGAAKRWPDGRGYTLEYAIPWACLAGADARPHPGETTGICWQIHWADPAGRVWRGQLMEVLTPGETGLVFHNARRWGRADWLPPSGK